MSKRQKKNEESEKIDPMDEEALLKEDNGEVEQRDNALVAKICTALATVIAQSQVQSNQSNVGTSAQTSTTQNETNTKPEKKEENDIITIDGVTYQRTTVRSMPVFTVPNVPPEDKLTGSKNLLKWKAKVNLHLRSLRLIDYIESEYGEKSVDLPINQRIEHDSQALQVLHATMKSEVVDLILHETTAFKAYTKIFELFEGNRCAEITLLEEKYEKLIFKSFQDDICFVNEFDRIHRDFRELGTTYDDEHLAARFLSKIEDKHDSTSPYFNFYHTMRTLAPEQRKYDYVKRQFLTVDNSYLKQMNRKRMHEEQKNNSQPRGTSNARPTKTTGQTSFGSRPLSNNNKPKLLRDIFNRRVSLNDLYSEEEQRQLKVMPTEEKRANACPKCGTLFPSTKELPLSREAVLSMLSFWPRKSRVYE